MTYKELTQERDRLTARQAEIGDLLEDAETPLADLGKLAQERAANVDVLAALTPRIEQAREHERQELDAQRDAAAVALRPAELAAHARVVEAAAALHEAIEGYKTVERELTAVGRHPLTAIPQALCYLCAPGLQGGRLAWARTAERVA